MSFVTPALLAGTLLVAVPIVLHLVMRRQPQHLEFPALRFLYAKREANRRRLRLRHLLLLLLRAAAIGLLAFGLARPAIKGAGLLGGQAAPVSGVLLIDTAPRMDYRQQNQTRLEVARETATWLLTQLPQQSEVAVIDGGTHAPAFAVDLGAARQQVERLRVAPGARPLPVLLADALNLLQQRREQNTGEPRREEVYIFTDLTEAGWSAERDGAADTAATAALRRRLEEEEDVALYVIDVGSAEPKNFALGQLHIARQWLAPGTPLDLSVELDRIGPEERRTVELLLVDEEGRPRKRGQQTELFSPDTARQVQFSIGELDQGPQQGYVRLVGEDGLAWDDVRYFTVEVRPAWPVLVVTPYPERAVFLSEALAPSAFRESRRARFTCKVIQPEQLTGEVLADYAAVCLLDPPPLTEAAWKQVADCVRAGGAAALFLGGAAQPIDQFNSEAALALLPGPLKRQSRSATYLAPANFHHPILAAFRPIESSIPWRSFPVLRYWQFGEEAAGAATIIPYANGDPALVERPLGSGRVLTMTTPVSDPTNIRGRDPWNLLPTGIEPWPFVMLANETLLYLVGSQNERLNYQPGEPAVFHVAQPNRPALVSLTLPGGEQIRQSVDPTREAMVITTTGQVGNYRVRAGGAEKGIDRGFSVNFDPQANRLERLEPEAIAELLGKDRFRLARNREQIVRDVNVGRVGRELFPLLICIVALALAIEHVLANRFYRRQ